MSGFAPVGVGASIETAEIADLAVSTGKLANSAVTYAKLQNLSATDKLLGRSTAGAGVAEEIACTAAGRAMLAAATAAAQAALLSLTPYTLFETFAAGTAYSLTNAQAAVAFGTTSPSITITTPGTYRIKGRVNVKYNAATFAAVRTLTCKLRRTNNTAADLANSSTAVLTAVITLLTYTLGVIQIPEVTYITANSDDVLSIFGGLDTAPSAGSLDIVEANITALRVA